MDHPQITKVKSFLDQLVVDAVTYPYTVKITHGHQSTVDEIAECFLQRGLGGEGNANVQVRSLPLEEVKTNSFGEAEGWEVSCVVYNAADAMILVASISHI